MKAVFFLEYILIAKIDKVWVFFFNLGPNLKYLTRLPHLYGNLVASLNKANLFWGIILISSNCLINDKIEFCFLGNLLMINNKVLFYDIHLNFLNNCRKLKKSHRRKRKLSEKYLTGYHAKTADAVFSTRFFYFKLIQQELCNT
jgi:hypothetical protein